MKLMLAEDEPGLSRALTARVSTHQRLRRRNPGHHDARHGWH